MAEDFTWRDGERTVRFGRGAIADAPVLLGTGYVLVTTERALAAAPQVAEAAGTTLLAPHGRVDEIAGDLLAAVPGDAAAVVALGGGRVVDVGKALASAHGLVAAAVPTTLSAAEMTWLGRRARGADETAPHLRPRIVLNDPALSASQPMPDLAASAANALGHAIEGAVTAIASPVPTLAAIEAFGRLARAMPEEGEPDRDELALGALLGGYAIDANWDGLHHVMSQTLARLAGAGHGPANAALLPVTSAALRARLPAAVAPLDAAAGEPIEDVARRFARRAGAARLRDIGIDEAALERCAEAAGTRPELALTPKPAGPREVLELYRAAW